MLTYINIRNIALIDKLEIYLDKGFNILTGETGVGKSIIINAINFGIGGRTSKELIRKGKDYAFVELLFEEDGEEIVLSRKLMNNGRNICKCNGETITVSILKQKSERLLDVHGQHEHQFLLDKNKHIEILDEFCKSELKDLKNILFKEYNRYQVIKRNIYNINGNDMERERKIDLLKFQLNEINDANLVEGEEEKIKEEKNILMNSDKLINGLNKIYNYLCSENSIVSQLGKCVREIERLTEIDVSLKDKYEILNEVFINTEELSFDIRDRSEAIDHNPMKLNEIEKRLDVLYNLKRKYGSNIKEVMIYGEKVEKELQELINSEDRLNELILEKERKEKQIYDICKQISVVRKEKAKQIEEDIESILKELEMKNVKFIINISNKEMFNENGLDSVEFLFSANKGEDVKQLDKIASGGEMSRLMLAIKSTLAGADKIDTLIFDEIDTGISGKTAQKVAERMKLLAKSHQIICITHLPQIAVMADCHYRIIKHELNDKTVSKVEKLSYKEKVVEIARLISGAEITDITLQHAEEMIRLVN